MRTLLTASALATFLTLSSAPYAMANDLETLVKDGKFFGEVRYRYEHVDQSNRLSNANAHTVRTNLGFQTGTFNGFSGLLETQIVQSMGDEDFNSLENGRTTFSTVADPDTAEINRAWIEYKGVPSTSVKLGRQFLNWDNQRFVGTVGWRQNDQTFDALTISNSSIENLLFNYSFVNRVNRVFDGDSPPADLTGNVNLASVSYKFDEWLTASSYGHWMDFDNKGGLTAATANQSNITFGIRLTGKTPINEDWLFSYEAEAAMQNDYGNSTVSYDENYYHIAPKVSGHGFTIGAGYEVLQGDGTNAFRTPLATLHKFNGWTDVFLNTPNNGLKDSYGTISYKFSEPGKLVDGLELTAAYHDFKGEEGGDFGSELDLSVGKAFSLPDSGQPFKKLNVLLKYADYNAEDAAYVDTQKIWLQVGVKF